MPFSTTAMTPIPPEKVSPAISVIMPLYNARPYLDEAVESVLGQTFADLELLIVDDHGTDGSVEIARRYAARDPRVRLLSTPRNSGAGVARNVALDVARGEFVTFMDPDDFIEPDMLAVMHAMAVEQDIDMVKMSLCHYVEGKDIDYVAGGEPVIYRDPAEIEAGARCVVFEPLEGDGPKLKFACAICGNLYRRDVLGDLRLLDRSALRVAEDSHFNYRYVKRCRSFARIPRTMYHYRYIPTSVSKSADPDFLETVSRIGESYEQLMDEYGEGERGRRFAASLAISLIVAGLKQIALSGWPRAKKREWTSRVEEYPYFAHLREFYPFDKLKPAYRLGIAAFYRGDMRSLEIMFKSHELLRRLLRRPQK